MADLTSSSIVESAVIEASHITALYDTFTGTTTYDNISIIGTASYATTASYVLNALSASYASTSDFATSAGTASLATTATLATSASHAITASYADGVLEATRATQLNANYIPTGSAVTSSGRFYLFMGAGQTEGGGDASLTFSELIGKTGLMTDIFATVTAVSESSVDAAISIVRFETSTGRIDFNSANPNTQFNVIGYYI